MFAFTSSRQALIAAALLAAGAMPLSAQDSSRPGETEFRWSGTVRSGDLLRVANIAGDVNVTTTEGTTVELVAKRHGGDADSDARVAVNQHENGLTVCALYGEESHCTERGPRNEGRRSWRGDGDHGHYDFELRVPRGMHVTATSVSGDVRVSGTTQELRATSVSGDVALERVRAVGVLEAKSVSGDVRARLDEVNRGTSLELKSVSGDITVYMPRSSGFDLDMSTVNGDLESDFALQMQGRFNRRHVRARANEGGSDIKVSTVSGDVRLANN